MRRQSFVASTLLLCLAMTACSPSEGSIQTAIAETAAAGPTATSAASATPVPIAEIDISPQILQPEDLGLEGAEIQDTNPEIWPLKNVPSGDSHLSRKLNNPKGEFVGWVSIFLFESLDELEQAFSIAEQNVTKYKVAENVQLGTRSISYRETLLAGVIFVDGHALVSVAVSEKSDEAIIYYAKALDDRLQLLLR